jgi:hypothetical protein
MWTRVCVEPNLQLLDYTASFMPNHMRSPIMSILVFLCSSLAFHSHKVQCQSLSLKYPTYKNIFTAIKQTYGYIIYFMHCILLRSTNKNGIETLHTEKRASPCSN